MVRKCAFPQLIPASLPPLWFKVGQHPSVAKATLLRHSNILQWQGVQEVTTSSQLLELDNEDSQDDPGWDVLKELEAGLLGPGTIAAP